MKAGDIFWTAIETIAMIAIVILFLSLLNGCAGALVVADVTRCALLPSCGIPQYPAESNRK